MATRVLPNGWAAKASPQVIGPAGRSARRPPRLVKAIWAPGTAARWASATSSPSSDSPLRPGERAIRSAEVATTRFTSGATLASAAAWMKAEALSGAGPAPSSAQAVWTAAWAAGDVARLPVHLQVDPAEGGPGGEGLHHQHLLAALGRDAGR